MTFRTRNEGGIVKRAALQRRIILSVILVLLLICSSVGPLRQVVFGNAAFTAADRAATRFVDEAFTRALAAYASARAVNAAISLLQGTELNLEPGGLGVTLTPGEALDPLNDMVERFSWLMLASLLSLGVQKFLIEISPWVSIQFLLTAALCLLLAHQWLRERTPVNLGLWGRYLLAAAVVIRFAVPAVAMANHFAYSHFLADRYRVATGAVEEDRSALDDLTTSLDDTRPAPGELREPGQGLLDRTMDALTGAREALSPESWRRKLEKKYEAAVQIGSRMIRRLVDLAVLFIINTVILPLLFLWGVLLIFRHVAGSNAAARLEKALVKRIG